MLAQEVTDELDSKADDSANTAAHAAFATQIAAKCEVVFGTYTGDGAASQTITLGFQPKALIVALNSGQISSNAHSAGGIIFAESVSGIKIVENGFIARYAKDKYCDNLNGAIYFFIAIK